MASMRDILERRFASIKDAWIKRSFELLFQSPLDGSVSQGITSAGLVITGAGGTTAKIGASDFYAVVDGQLVKIAAATAMPALTGLNIAQSQYNVIVFTVDAFGNVYALMGNAAAAIGGVQFPVVPTGQAMIGFLLITYAAGNFVGGTTPLDTATTLYFSPLGDLNPGLSYSLL